MESDRQSPIFNKMIFTGVMSLSLGGVYGVHYFLTRAIHQQADRNQALTHQVREGAADHQEIQVLIQQKKALHQRMQIIQQLQKSRSSVVQIWEGLVRIVPEGVYLTDVSRIENRLLIEGQAECHPQISLFMRLMGETSWLKDPQLTLIQADSSVKNTTNTMIYFQMHAIENGSNE